MLIVSNVFVAVVASAQSQSDPLTKQYKARMDRLNHFLKITRAPDELRYRTREYLRQSRELIARQGFADLFDMFSPRLRGDMLGHMAVRSLMLVRCFRSCEEGFVKELSHALSHVGYERGDSIRYVPTAHTQ